MKTLEEMLVAAIDCEKENVVDYVLERKLDVVYDAMKVCANEVCDRIFALYLWHDGSMLLSEIIEQVKNELK